MYVKKVSSSTRMIRFKASTNVLFENDWVPIDLATDTNKMEMNASRLGTIKDDLLSAQHAG